MKYILTIFTLLFTTMLSSTSFSEWTRVATGSGSGTIFYVDFERVRKHDGYVYWWELGDFLKPDKYGDLSAKVYHEGDCKLFRHRVLSYSFHKEAMGRGTGDVQESVKKLWRYPPPNSVSEQILKLVCSR